MNQFIEQLISSIFQVLLFGLLPFIWWLTTKKIHKSSFFTFLGIKRLPSNQLFKVIFPSFVALIAFVSIGYFSIKSVSDISILANSSFTSLTLWTTFSIILYSFIQTAFSEELFFRGFLAKRLINKLGYTKGNFIQSSLFGLTHVLLLLSKDNNLFMLIFIGIFTGGIGYILCYINEKLADGSILPSWLIHSCTNVISTLFIIFLLR